VRTGNAGGSNSQQKKYEKYIEEMKEKQNQRRNLERSTGQFKDLVKIIPGLGSQKKGA